MEPSLAGGRSGAADPGIKQGLKMTSKSYIAREEEGDLGVKKV